MRKSVKQQLIEACEQKASELESAAITYRMDAHSLRNRGSGPLPWWAKLLASEFGINGKDKK